MFCKYCGQSIPNESQVCSYCGKSVARTTAVPTPPPQEETYDDYEPEQTPQKKNTGMLTLIIFMAGLIVVLIAALIMSSVISKSPGETDDQKPQITDSAAEVTQSDAESSLPADNAYSDVYQNYDSYVLSGSNNSYKCYRDIQNLSEEELTIAEQEIYARHGKKFSDPELQAYFEACSWYTPSSGSFKPNTYEQANLDLIRVYRDKQDGSLYRSGNGYIDAFSRSVDYAIPSSNSRALNANDLDHLTEQQLCVARNEILARHGWLFEDKLLREYFYSKEWYEPSIPGANFDYSVLSSTEQSNISMIQIFERRAEGGNQWSANNPYRAVYYKYEYQDYIFASSSVRRLQNRDLDGMTEDELCIARNEIFARNGYTFTSTNLLEYFFHRSWYSPYTAAGDSSSIHFSAIENDNINLINAAEKEAAKNSDKIYRVNNGPDLSSLDTTLNYTLYSDALSVKVPNYWKTYAKIETGSTGFSFHEKSSYASFGGHLYTIVAMDDYEYLPSYKILGTLVSPDGVETTLIAWYATDCQFEMSAQALYNKMWQEDSRIFKTITGINGWTFIPT